MPRGDGTGPIGMGPMTGRGAGYCAGSNTPGYANPAPRMGMGFRRGAGFYGRGFGSGFARGAGRGFGRGFARRPINYATVARQQPFQPPQNPQQPQTQPAQTQQAPQPAYPATPQPQTSAKPSRAQEIQMLEDQLAAMESQTSQIRERIEQLKSQRE